MRREESIMADEREHIRVVTTSDIIENKSEVTRSRVGGAAYRNITKDSRKEYYHRYDDHKELKRKGESRKNLAEKRKVIDRKSIDEQAKKTVRSRVEVVKKPKDDRPLIITVRNDIKDSGKRGYHSDHNVDEKEYNREWKTKANEVKVRRRDSEQEQRMAISHDESSDVDSDYTIEMRSHQGSDDNGGDDDDDNESVYSVEFKNIGGSDEEDEDDKDGQSDGANEDELDGGISKQYVIKEKDLQKLTAEAAESNDIEGAENETVSSEYSEDDEKDARDQKRTVVVRKSRNNDVDVKENRSPEIEKKPQDAGKKSNEEISPIVYSNEKDFAEIKMEEFSEEKPIDKFVADKEMEHDSEGGMRDFVDNKTKSNGQKGLVNEERKGMKGMVKDAVNYDTIVDAKDKSTKILVDARTKTKISNEKKLREEIKILEEKLGKEQSKKAPEKVANAAHVEKRGSQKPDISRSEKLTGRGLASRSADGKVIHSEKRSEDMDVIDSKSANAGKPKEGSADNKSVKASRRNSNDRSVGGKSSSAKKSVNAVVKEQTEIRKDASKDTMNSIPKAEKKSTQGIKDSSDRITVDRKQVKSVPEGKEKSRFNDVQHRGPTGKRKQDNFAETKKLENAKKSQKWNRRGSDGSSSESSSSEDSKVGSSSSSSSSDQSGSESTSESETESDNSGSESGKSKSGRSSDSDSNSSSDSSQSSASDSESSSSEEDNFKRRRRRSSESKPVNTDVKQRYTSPRKEKEPRYISPLRTKRSEWGTRRHEDNHRYKRTDEKYRKLPERREKDQSYNRFRRFSKDRVRQRTRSRSWGRDRNSTQRHPRSRDRTDTRARMGSRERKYSRNRLHSQDRARGSRHVGDYKRDSNTLRNQKSAIGDRKEAVERRRTNDRGRERKSSREASKEESHDKLNQQPHNRNAEKSNKKSDSIAPKTRIPQKETVLKDADKSKPIPSREKSSNLRESGSHEDLKSDIVKVESPSDTPTDNALMTKENKKPKPLMELNIKVEETEEDAAKTLLETATEPQSNTLSSKTVSTDKSQKLKHEVKDEPKPLMEITLSTVTPPNAEPEGRQLRRVSMTGLSNLRATKESKSPRSSVERRQVRRVDQSNNTDVELTNEKRSENKNDSTREEPEERNIVNSRVYLKRLSSGKAVYFENRKIEPLMKPIDFDSEVIKKPRMVESIYDENENQRSIRRVISDSSSDIPQIQITSDGLQPQSKRKIFSRLGRNITKPKNISINLKTNPVREDSKGAPTVKTENEVELDQRIKSIREKNAEILRRQKEIEEDIKLNS